MKLSNPAREHSAGMVETAGPTPEAEGDLRHAEARAFLEQELGPRSAALLEEARRRRAFAERLAAGQSVQDAALGAIYDVVARDRSVGGEFLRFLHPRLHGMARHLVGPALRHREESADLLQSVLEDLWPGFCGLEFETLPQFLAALRRRLDFKASDHVRRALAERRRDDLRRGLPEELVGPSPGPRTEAERREEVELILRALDCLHPNERFAIIRRGEGVSAAEIGRDLGMSPGAAQKLLERARQRMVRFAERLQGGAEGE